DATARLWRPCLSRDRAPRTLGRMQAVSREPDRRIVTIPNAISAARLLCVPLFLWLLWGAEERVGAAWLLAVLGASDWVDGYIARRFDQGSELGKVLDPTADRALLLAGAVALL